jgi:hypothetical protein
MVAGQLFDFVVFLHFTFSNVLDDETPDFSSL